LLLKNHK